MVIRRGASRLGCLLPLLIIAVAAYFAVDFGEAYFRFYQFKDAMGQEARFATTKTDDQITTRLAALADTLQLPPGAEPGKVHTVHHIGFVVKRPENVDQWAERLRGQGIPLAQEPKSHRDGARSFYFHDPDGLLIQLIYHPPISDNSL